MQSTPSRRAFLITGAGAVLGAAAPASRAVEKPRKKQLIHHALFWLKNPSSKEDRAKLIAGLRNLEAIETILDLHIGLPPPTEKEAAVDADYSVSALLFFDDPAGQKTYDYHPIHKKFIDTCGPLWAKVVAYDAADV